MTRLTATIKTIIFFSLLFLPTILLAQTVCTAPGQNPSTAFPVCGTSTFSQASVPLCGERPLPFPGCPADQGLLTDKNPFWYKFTCFQAGTLAFLITPNTLSSDYDWELYDVTGRNPNDVYVDGSMVIANNWSGETGLTGASQSGTQAFVCGGSGKPLFSRMPQLVAGRNYLLLISHFTNSQSGYKLSFGGGTAVITDPNEPHLQNAEASCGGDVVRVKLSKKIKCNSIAANGSEFFITPGAINVTSTAGITCSSQFDADSLSLQLSAPLPPGTYTLNIRKGTDNNTLLDFCDRAIAETETLSFTVLPKAPTPMDSIAPLRCAPNQLRLVFQKPLLCSSIAANGSDFIVTGSYPVSVTAANGVCTNNLSKEVIVTLSQPLQAAGSFQIILKRGSDGNTLINECAEETLENSSLPFSVQDTVDASFTYAINYGCTTDVVSFFHTAANGVNSWQWNLDEAQQSGLQNPQAFYQVFNEKTVRLVVSNGFCSDTTEQKVKLENFLKAGFNVFEDNCPNEPVAFTGEGIGKIIAHEWSFGDGGTAATANPSYTYAAPVRQTVYTVRYTVVDSFGCRNTAQKTINVYPSCYLAVPTAFTPNNDGKNDFFGVANAVKADKLELLVFNRWGQMVFKTTNWKQTWDGRVGGALPQTSVFVWFLRYTDRDTKRKMEQKGTVTLIR